MVTQRQRSRQPMGLWQSESKLARLMLSLICSSVRGVCRGGWSGHQTENKNKENGDKKMKNRKQGFTLVEIMIVVMIIGLLAAIALPGFQRARRSAQANACINNLRQIAAAKDQWAIETNQPDTATPDAGNLDDFLRGGTGAVVCPQSGEDGDFASSYTIGSVDDDPLCRINAAEHFLPTGGDPAQ